jgi:hypothetical protein
VHDPIGRGKVRAALRKRIPLRERPTPRTRPIAPHIAEEAMPLTAEGHSDAWPDFGAGVVSKGTGIGRGDMTGPAPTNIRPRSNSGDQTTSFTPSGQGSTAATYGGNGQGDRLSFGTTTHANGLQGLLSATTSGASTYYERDPSGTMISERGPGGEFYYLTDGLASTVALVDTTGTVQATYSYDPCRNSTTVGGPNPAIAGGNPLPLCRWLLRHHHRPLDSTRQPQHPPRPPNGNRYAYTGDDPTNGIDLQSLGAYDPNGCTSPARYDVSQEIPPPQDAPISIDCTLAIIGLAGTGIGYATGPITFGASAIAAGFGTAGVISAVREC